MTRYSHIDLNFNIDTFIFSSCTRKSEYKDIRMLPGAIPGYNFHDNDTEEDTVLFLQSHHTLRLNCKHGCVRQVFNLYTNQTADMFHSFQSLKQYKKK